jgi:nucleotide-binding universal stress UspA family protein
MTYKTVMVGLALGQPNDARLEVAAQLAERFGARVIGTAAAEFSPPLYFTEGEPAQRLIDQGWAAVRNRLKELESAFRAAMQNRAVEVEWRCGEDFPTRFIVQQARACDIIVVGEASRGGLADPFVQVNPSDLVMQVGRPCWSFQRPATGWTCGASWLPGRTPPKRGGRSATRCRCFVNPARSQLSKLSRTRPIAPRRCCGLRMSRRGCRGMAYGHRSRCPSNVAMPLRSWSAWHRTSALA